MSVWVPAGMVTVAVVPEPETEKPESGLVEDQVDPSSEYSTAQEEALQVLIPGLALTLLTVMEVDLELPLLAIDSV